MWLHPGGGFNRQLVFKLTMVNFSKCWPVLVTWILMVLTGGKFRV